MVNRKTNKSADFKIDSCTSRKVQDQVYQHIGGSVRSQTAKCINDSTAALIDQGINFLTQTHLREIEPDA